MANKKGKPIKAGSKATWTGEAGNEVELPIGTDMTSKELGGHIGAYNWGSEKPAKGSFKINPPQNRARDGRRVVAVGKLGPGFGRGDWERSESDPSGEVRNEGSLQYTKDVSQPLSDWGMEKTSAQLKKIRYNGKELEGYTFV